MGEPAPWDAVLQLNRRIDGVFANVGDPFFKRLSPLQVNYLLSSFRDKLGVQSPPDNEIPQDDMKTLTQYYSWDHCMSLHPYSSGQRVNTKVKALRDSLLRQSPQNREVYERCFPFLFQTFSSWSRALKFYVRESWPNPNLAQAPHHVHILRGIKKLFVDPSGRYPEQWTEETKKIAHSFLAVGWRPRSDVPATLQATIRELVGTTYTFAFPHPSCDYHRRNLQHELLWKDILFSMPRDEVPRRERFNFVIVDAITQVVILDRGQQQPQEQDEDQPDGQEDQQQDQPDGQEDQQQDQPDGQEDQQQDQPDAEVGAEEGQLGAEGGQLGAEGGQLGAEGGLLGDQPDGQQDQQQDQPDAEVGAEEGQLGDQPDGQQDQQQAQPDAEVGAEEGQLGAEEGQLGAEGGQLDAEEGQLGAEGGQLGAPPPKKKLRRSRRLQAQSCISDRQVR